MLLAPNLADFQQMQVGKLLASWFLSDFAGQDELAEPCHPAHIRGNGPEQDFCGLSRVFQGQR